MPMVAVTSVQEAMVLGSVQEAGELVDCPLQLGRAGDCSPQAVMAVKTPLGSRRVVDCRPQAGMAVKTPLGSRRVVDCRPQAGVAVKSCSWELSGEAASL